jgi:general secretion pathway protein C
MQFSSVWSGRLALVLAAVLALLIAWSLVRLAWLVVDGPRVDPAPMPPVPRALPQGAANGDFRWELFGSSAETVRTDRLAQAPATSLSLRLKGVVAAGAGGYAIIAGDGGEDRVYRVGDELDGGARVEAIEARRVLIERDGRTEALELDTAQPASAATTRTGARGGATEPAQLAGIRGLDSPRGISGGVASLPEAAAMGRGNLQELAGAISVLPVSGGGFRVRPGRDARLFNDLGLQVNDVVTAINGQPLESEDDVQALFADIMRRGEIAITVNRQGREMTLRPDLQDILGRME